MEEAIIGLRGRVENGCVIKRAMIMGADYYETDEERTAMWANGEVCSPFALCRVAQN